MTNSPEPDIEAILAEVENSYRKIDQSMVLSEEELRDLDAQADEMGREARDAVASNTTFLETHPQHRRVLIVDDSKVSRRRIRTLFDGFKVVIDEAGSGHQAIEYLQTVPRYHLMTLDFNMPSMNGMDVVESLHEKNLQVPTLIITTENEKNTIVRALSAGVDNYLIKPYETQRAIDTIEKVLERHQTPFFRK